VQVDDGLLSSNFYAYDPAIGTYIVLTADFGDPFAGSAVPVWNGVMAEVQDVTPSTTTVAFTASSAFVDPVNDDTFVGLLAGEGGGEARLPLLLDRVTDAGDVPADRATLIRFRADAVMGWDVHDGSKPVPPAATALLATVGERDGEVVRQAVRSLPVEIGPGIDVPLAVTATEAGTYRVGADMAAFPAEWSARVTDLLTGDVVNLRDGPYTFEAAAGAWNERFVLTIAATTTDQGPAAGDAYVSVVAPNPASDRALLSVRVPSSQRVRADVFDALGRRVTTVLDVELGAGETHPIGIQAGGLAPGTYVVRVAGETFVEVRRVVIRR
jgi:hypothetical protein